MRSIRRIELIWSENQVGDYELLKELAHASDSSLPDYVKDVLRKHLRRNDT
jgi:hypothetical protein